MSNFERKRNIEVNEIIAVIRVLSIFLMVFSIYSYAHIRIVNNMMINYLIILLSIIIILIITYCIWGYFLKSSIQTLHPPKMDIAYLIIEVLMITAIIYFTGAHLSNYKNLFFVSVIAASIRFGSKMGLLSSSLSVAGITFNDMVFQMDIYENKYLEADLVIMVTFLVTGWMLGTLVEKEIEYRKKLSEKANTDEVTGLYNHRYFQERLNIEVESAKENLNAVALIMIDIDYFKFYNDTFGHQQGDMLLKDISEILKGQIEDKGIICRYGGDEFAVVLQNVKAKQASDIAEGIRKSIVGRRFFGEETLPRNEITVSVGIAIYPDNAMDKDELIKKADDAMYKAKFMSKNRVELYFSVLDDLKASLNESEQNLLNSIRTLITVINAKDKYTYGHSERVVVYATMIAEAMGLSEVELRELRYGAYLHDIGKIEISRDILNKQTSLTEEEWHILKSHPVWGADIIRPIKALSGSMPTIFYHHERFDGNGYPEGLKGDNIPLCARILTVADSFDAMVTNRPYKIGKSFEESVEELKKCSGTQFDPVVVQKFIDIMMNRKIKIIS